MGVQCGNQKCQVLFLFIRQFFKKHGKDIFQLCQWDLVCQVVLNTVIKIEGVLLAVSVKETHPAAMTVAVAIVMKIFMDTADVAFALNIVFTYIFEERIQKIPNNILIVF